MTNIVNKKLKIDGMHCSSCALSIDFDLEDLGGVVKAKTSFARQETEVEFDDSSVNPDDLIKQVAMTGYKASLLD